MTRPSIVAGGESVSGGAKREREIAQLIARGQSNREIAEALVISVKTVETHVQHMFRKLQVQSRAEIAVVATRHGLA